MARPVALIAVIVAVFGGSHLARMWLAREAAELAPSAGPPQRIVSMAPSITEILFSLGIGDRVKGVTRYCLYPPEVAQKAHVGGFLDPNFEAVVALRPDLVILPEGDEQNLSAFDKLGLRTLLVYHKNIEGILESIATIGQVCGAEDRARQLTAEIRGRMERVRKKTSGLPRPRVLCVVDRTFGTGRVQDAYVAGADGHIDRLIALAGGQNAYRGAIRFPVISGEGILRINPQVIVEFVPQVRADQVAALRADWQSLAEIEAVAAGRIHVLGDPRDTVPGPRFIDVVETLARLIHPEVNWTQ